MKKVVISLILALVCLLVFAGCSSAQDYTESSLIPTEATQEPTDSPTEATSHMHNWTDATCDRPRICTRCGRSDGEPLAHEWKSIGDEGLRMCSLCRVFECEIAGHIWKDTVCGPSRICSLCSAADGTVPAHTFGKWYPTENSIHRTCKTCEHKEVRSQDLFLLIDEYLTGNWKSVHITVRYDDGQGAYSQFDGWSIVFTGDRSGMLYMDGEAKFDAYLPQLHEGDLNKPEDGLTFILSLISDGILSTEEGDVELMFTWYPEQIDHMPQIHLLLPEDGKNFSITFIPE